MNKEQLKQLEAELWRSADTLRANSDLKASEYSTPVLGLIFLKFADNKYKRAENEILTEFNKVKGTRREKPISEIAIEKCGFYLPDHARYDDLLTLPESKNVAKAIKNAMLAIEEYKPELADVLPKDDYARLDSPTLKKLLRNFANIPQDASGDILGQIYEYFLGNFALAEGQGGGEFFTPRSVVRLMVEIIEPHGGTVFDPACGSGGMFVQSAQFIGRHRADAASKADVFVYGQEKTLATVKLARMNLAVNGLRGEIMKCISYNADPFDSFGKFDYVLANPPFNVDDVPLDSVKGDPRFNTYGVPQNKSKPAGKKAKDETSGKGIETVPNANYLWISLFATSLKAKGRAALVMANSASDARHSEAEIRQKLIEANLIYGMLTLPSNMFYTVTLPATLWFFDRAKEDKRILFIDARNIFTQIDRAHREFSEAQVQNIALISRLHKGRREEFVETIDGYFASGLAQLVENHGHIGPLAQQIDEGLDDAAAKAAMRDLSHRWGELAPLKAKHVAYLKKHAARDIDTRNRAQIALREAFAPFFRTLHEDLKTLDKALRAHEKRLAEAARAEGKRPQADRSTRAVKNALDTLHAEVMGAELWFKHIEWLQTRFPEAKYEDVTGLCKLASLEEVREQDYSLNPGRYVGVVIEEDGKTEEEFIADLVAMNGELSVLNVSAHTLGATIAANIKALVGEN